MFEGKRRYNYFHTFNFHVKNTNAVSRDYQFTYIMNAFKKLNRLDCYYKGILCEMEEGVKIVNMRHALQIILLLFDFYINISLPSSLSFRARMNALLGSTSCYLVVFS